MPTIRRRTTSITINGVEIKPGPFSIDEVVDIASAIGPVPCLSPPSASFSVDFVEEEPGALWRSIRRAVIQGWLRVDTCSWEW